MQESTFVRTKYRDRIHKGSERIEDGGWRTEDGVQSQV